MIRRLLVFVISGILQVLISVISLVRWLQLITVTMDYRLGAAQTVFFCSDHL